MDERPSFEDSLTEGMHAIADGIARSIEVALLEELRAVVRMFAGLRRVPLAEPPQPPQP